MTRRAARRVGLLLCALLGVARAGAAEPPWQLEAGVGTESLDNGAPDWRQVDLTLRARWAPRTGAEAGLRSVQRYGRSDRELSIGLALPLDAQWSLALRGTAADAPRFLPRQGAQFEFTRALPDGWVASGGLGRNLYPGSDSPPSGSSTLRLALERYVEGWRFAGGFGRARLDGGAAGNGWRAQADRWFGDEARIGVIVARGDELENAPGGVLETRVDAFVLVGRWPLAAGWALTGEIGRTRVGGIVRRTGDRSAPTGPGYHRTGGRVGVQYGF